MSIYYNEIDPYCVAWLQNLMDACHIAKGVIDTRSIEDVRPDELAGYTQCHFFAGIGVWSLALRSAGWPDSRPVWTGSCPCQPFSAAGKGAGFADERHLWPAWQHLIAQCRPARVLGEQVASKDAEPWIDLVHADLEGMGYAFGCVPFPSAGIGAPHIRDRSYWVADADHAGLEGWGALRERAAECLVGTGGVAGRLAYTDGWNAGSERQQCSREQRQQSQDGGVERLADAEQHNRGRETSTADHVGTQADRSTDRLGGHSGSFVQRPGPTNSFWRDADWLGCTDGKFRPVSAKPQPLVDGSSESLGRVRPETIAQIEEEIDAVPMESKIRRSEVLRALQDSLGAEAQPCWAAGRLPHLHEAPFLLAFLRQLQEQGWEIEKGSALPREEVEALGVRVLRDGKEASGSPRQRGLDGQQPGEFADAVHFLSSLLARHAHSAWGYAYAAYAETVFPLSVGSRDRVGRLRAYGNAINARAAQAFIESYCEARGLTDLDAVA